MNLSIRRIRASRHGFTLVELLVVMAIIGLLLSMLTPAIDRAMKAAEAAKCLATINVWGRGMQFYALENQGRRLSIDYGLITDIGNEPSITWFHLLGKYVGNPSFTGMTPKDADALGRPIMDANRCPSAKQDSAIGGYGSATRMWNISRTQGAYGVNNWVVQMKQSQYDEPGYEFTGKYTSIPGSAVFIADCNYVDSYPKPDEEIPTPDTESGSTSDRGINRNLIDRHGGALSQRKAINAGYVDGSVQNVELWQVWTLKWNTKSKAVHDYKDYEPYQ